MLTRCLEKYLSNVHQTSTYDVLWVRDECFKFWGQKVTVPGHGGTTYAGTVTVQAEALLSDFLVLFNFFTVLAEQFVEAGAASCESVEATAARCV